MEEAKLSYVGLVGRKGEEIRQVVVEALVYLEDSLGAVGPVGDHSHMVVRRERRFPEVVRS